VHVEGLGVADIVSAPDPVDELREKKKIDKIKKNQKVM